MNHPSHYRSHPSGIECIDIVRFMTFNLGNVIKYLWRAGLKDGEPSLKDLKKAEFYLRDEIKRVEDAERDAKGVAKAKYAAEPTRDLWVPDCYVEVTVDGAFRTVYLQAKGTDSVLALTFRAAEKLAVTGHSQLYLCGRELEDNELLQDIAVPGVTFTLRVTPLEGK